jgi:hypothetical protein
MGFSKVRRYAGGIVDWERAGLILFQELLPLRKLHQPTIFDTHCNQAINQILIEAAGINLNLGGNKADR